MVHLWVYTAPGAMRVNPRYAGTVAVELISVIRCMSYTLMVSHRYTLAR